MSVNKKLPYVLSDLDGTLSDSSLTISDRTAKDILAYQKASGGHFSFVTGRLAAATKYLAHQIGITLPLVSCNGALISDWKTGKIFYAKYLDHHVVAELIESARGTGIEPVIYTEDQLAGLRSNPRIMMWKNYSNNLPKNLRCGIHEYDNLEDLIEAIKTQAIRPIQLVFYAPEKKEQKVAREILKRYESKVNAVPSFAHVFNITAVGANKLTGLKAFAKIIGINYRDIVVFGDNYNDVPMIEGVKRGFVVANGEPEVKKIAYKVIPAMNENGVGNTLKSFIETEIYD